MLADLDTADLHVTLKDYVTRQPYVMPDGTTSMDMPYEALSYSAAMYEPKSHQLSAATITLKSMLAADNLRPLYQQIKEGCRVELYRFQPDCGDPVFAGFVPPNGLSEQNGSLILEVQDSLVQGTWQHLQIIEESSLPIKNWYDRALTHWIDIVNEDFSAKGATAASYITGPYSIGGIPEAQASLDWSDGLKVTATGGDNDTEYSYVMEADKAIVLAPGDTYLFDCFVEYYCDGHYALNVGSNSNYGEEAAFTFGLFGSHSADLYSGTTHISFSDTYRNATSSPPTTYPHLVNNGSGILGYLSGADIPINNGSNPPSPPTNWTGDYVAEPPPQAHRLTGAIRIDAAGLITVTLAVDGQVVGSSSKSGYYVENSGTRTFFNQNPYYPAISLAVMGLGQYVKVRRWRLRKLVPYITEAGRFNPQSATAIYFQPNQEDMVSFLDFLLQNDGAEVRVNYKAWPALDQIELDAVGALGKSASAQLGYDSLPIAGAPTSPSGVGTELGAFATAPLFRFEEGYNLGDIPIKDARQLTHANEIIKAGSGQVITQLQAQVWAAQEVGNPITGIVATYPYFEAVSSDNRAASLNLIQSLAATDLTLALDTTPSLTIRVADDPRYAFRWREGDTVWVRTVSLINNVEQLMRIMHIEYEAGSAFRTVMLGRVAWDPTLQRIMARDMVMDWLYEQNTNFGTVFAYPMVPSTILSGASSSTWTFALDQFTTGSRIVSAQLRWFSSAAAVSSLQAFLGGNSVSSAAAGIDSGSIDVTQLVQAPTVYTLNFKNNSGGSMTLAGAFLTVQIRT